MLPRSLLERLADGREHSRTELRESLELDADALAEQIEQLRATGLEVVAGADDGIRLREPIDWIDPAGIESRLSADHRQRVESLEHAFEIESTNRHLLDGRPPAPAMARIAVAEYQTAGRGRRGRSWTMPPGTGVALSASWQFGPEHGGLEALSLAVGAVARRAVRDVTRLEIGLKWPNDLLVDGAKLGGILVELTPLADGACHAVVGIGINVSVPAAFLARASDLPQGACDLATAAPHWPVDRAALAARLIEQLIELFMGFPARGFEPYRPEWLAAHVLNGRPVEMSTQSGTAFGRVVDVAADGALIIEHESGERRRLISGDVTIRAGR
ncbi:MAG: biotin--[acetyl-CoA-carboxylase] ligase [Gammaproteobacteria bacterium]|jgi:BirA family biotin operon repressor/biotin-[acetyl-CoA-carboxylase] ligase